MEISDTAVRALAGLLEARTGQQLAVSRRWRLETALRPLMQVRGIEDVNALAARLGGDRMLADAVVEALLNHETFFFRDCATFQTLDALGLERLRQARPLRRLRIWSAGCSMGQEAYTIAMMIADRPERWGGWTVEILGTDVSAHAIERARSGRYSQFEIQRGLPVMQMVRRFDQQGEEWQADDKLRKAVSFRTHNLLDPPPLGGFDVILCRNVLLYFAPDMRRRAFERLASAIQPDGILMLGAGETVLGHTERFAADEACRGFYRPVAAADRRPAFAAAAR
ncbi:MAG TPA: protein-glutamate O-methyltransferase CheR [Sphingomonas sp.]|nr:protein-glutamate O-methyltransferase CheR [Sphingomonas sp.]